MDNRTIVGIGEVLWDVFPDGPRFGGAPANFACNAAQLAGPAARVYVVSAVGRDPLGLRAKTALGDHGVETSHLQTHEAETGQVLVTIDAAGIASYRFAEPSAWDALAWSDGLAELAGTVDAVCFGTLGQRAEPSRATIRRFVAATRQEALRILDINLRPPYADPAVIVESLPLANVLKLNDTELPIVANTLQMTGSETDVMLALLERFEYRLVALTRGAEGAVLVTADTVLVLPGEPVAVADTVGAGDAFTASLTLGLLAGRPLAEIGRHAIAVASFVCTQPGATGTFPPELRVQ